MRSRIPGKLAMLWCSPSYRKRMYISSDSTMMSFSAASSASRSRSSLPMTLPQGLLGELSTIILVFGVIWSATSSTSTLNSLEGSSLMGDGTPPTNLIMDS